MYIKHVKDSLKSIKPGLGRLAGYNTGYGISICPELCDDVSALVDTLSVVQTCIVKISPPQDGPEWDIQWKQCKSLINRFIAQYNKKGK